MKTALIALTDGFEEIEAVTPVDILRRAGVEVIVAGVGKLELTGAHAIKVKADIELEKYHGSPDALILPGGSQGAENLRDSKVVSEWIRRMDSEKKIIAAICASPAVVLTPSGVLDGKKATGYPGYEKNFTLKITFSQDRVVADGRIITSRGPGTALEFALEIVRQLVGEKMAQEISEQTLAMTNQHTAV